MHFACLITFDYKLSQQSSYDCHCVRNIRQIGGQWHWPNTDFWHCRWPIEKWWVRWACHQSCVAIVALFHIVRLPFTVIHSAHRSNRSVHLNLRFRVLTLTGTYCPVSRNYPASKRNAFFDANRCCNQFRLINWCRPLACSMQALSLSNRIDRFPICGIMWFGIMW